MTISEIQKQFRDSLSPYYGEREAKAITKLVLETKLELNPTQLSFERFRLVTQQQQQNLNAILERLLKNEPVQYVLGEADFFGLRFKVNEHVLIPRPETEELVQWAIELIKDNSIQQPKILDIGTGSGCIPIALAQNLAGSIVEACDVSGAALQVAVENNSRNQTAASFFKLDVLKEEIPSQSYDLIISNPPYIAQHEKSEMAAHVLNFEPHLALFVPNENAFVFYQAISKKAEKSLRPGGLLLFEINEAGGAEVVSLMEKAGYVSVELKKDLSGRDRMVKGMKGTD